MKSQFRIDTFQVPLGYEELAAAISDNTEKEHRG